MGHVFVHVTKKKKKLFFYKPDLSFNPWVLCDVGFSFEGARIPSSKGGAFCDTIFYFHVLLYLKIEALNVRG